MYNDKQQKIIDHTIFKIKNLFSEHPVISHDLDHIMRVGTFAVEIAKKENANIFLCYMTALLHDVGRVKEFYGKNKKSHHELSYFLCQKWFREDDIFKLLTKKEKIEILYSVRYHYNNVADKYITASILRDADKLDLFGKVGLKRHIDFWGKDTYELNKNLRLALESSFWFCTKTAKKIFEKNKLLKPVLDYYKKSLKKKISKVEL